MKSFKHDYINILISMAEYINQNDMENLKEYFDNNILSISKDIDSRDFKLGLIQNIKIPELKGIVSSKIIRAHKDNINIFIDILEPIQNINMNIVDLCRVIGILLDNAIEAAKKTSSKSIKFGLVSRKNSVTIIVINSCPHDTIEIFKIYENGFSTKGLNRGVGLSNLKKYYLNITIFV
ncbi:sensor histidine kinase [Gottschalkia acidurici]|nr:GHKL domain-containing protein [Gottschalkia acidurici]